MALPEVDLTTLEESIDTTGMVLVDFWGPMCGPCLVLKPHLERLAAEHAGRIRFVAVNAEKETTAAERFGVTAVPTIVLFEDGVETLRLTGAVLPSQVAALLQSRPV